ncbi:MAG: hypothetical protein KBS59_01230 [Clostridiales bacterium]|nr:hypothetical protein [Clostridiales bacterium]
MAEKKETVYEKPTNKEEPKAKKENLQTKVPVFVPRGAGDKYVSVNGRNFILPEGQTSYVPKFIANEITRSEDALEKYEIMRAKMLQQTKTL